jgi:hypothetical protein
MPNRLQNNMEAKTTKPPTGLLIAIGVIIFILLIVFGIRAATSAQKSLPVKVDGSDFYAGTYTDELVYEFKKSAYQTADAAPIKRLTALDDARLRLVARDFENSRKMPNKSLRQAMIEYKGGLWSFYSSETIAAADKVINRLQTLGIQ